MQAATSRPAIQINASTAPADAAMGRLLEQIGASWMTQAISVAAELRLADLLATGPRAVEALGRETQCDPAALHRLLRALTSLELFVEQDDGAFALAPAGTLLCADSPQSVRSWAIWCGKYHWPVWANLLGSVRSGISARELATGRQGYAHIEGDQEGAAIFNGAMVAITRLIADELARVVDFSTARSVVDVGGGHGELLTVILSAHPHLRGTLFDLPHAMSGAATRAAQAGVPARCEFASGSFFDAIPAGADFYLLKSILHNWDDDQCGVILQNCRRAMAPGARLLVVERIMPQRLGTSAPERAVARSDLNMLVSLTGRERTMAELASLFAGSGFRVAQTWPAVREFSAIEVRPVP